jgi:hypothetical protein
VWAGMQKEIVDTARRHFEQQSSDFPLLAHDDHLHNALGMTSLDIAASQSINNNIIARNEVQKVVGEFGTVFDGKRIQDLRKAKQQRTRKSNPIVKGAHKPVSYMITPTKNAVTNSSILSDSIGNDSRKYRNGLYIDEKVLEDDDEDSVEVVSPPHNSAFESHKNEVQKLLLGGTVESPVDMNKVEVFKKLANGDPITIEVLKTTLMMNLDPKAAVTKLVEVILAKE